MNSVALRKVDQGGEQEHSDSYEQHQQSQLFIRLDMEHFSEREAEKERHRDWGGVTKKHDKTRILPNYLHFFFNLTLSD